MIFGKMPSPPLGNTAEAVWHRALLRWLADLVLRDVVGGKIIPHPAGGFSILVDRQIASGTGGWHFHETKEYDPETQYSVNEAVIVSPTNTAATAGVSNIYGGGGVDPADGGALVGLDGYGENGDKATPGTWVCVKAPKVLHGTQPGDPDAPRNYLVHVPVWSLPDGDPDSANNYWLLVGLYPVTLTLCVDGVSTPYYMQAQPVPEEFITGEGGETMTGEGGEGLTPE